MVTLAAFVVLVLLVAGQRVAELVRSARNERALLAEGAVEHAPEQMPVMRALHAGWLVAMPLEVWLLDRPLVPWLAALALALFALGQLLRWSAMRALGPRWTVRVLVLPGRPAVRGGIFEHVRHPNYAGVILELAALPLVHGAWITAALFSAANALLLAWRIRAEEAALRSAGAYAMDRPRFFPVRRG